MKLVIFANKHYEEEKALVDLDKNEVLLKGDYYHDKIDHLIEGYILALVGFGIIINEDVPTEWINREHKLYDFLEFYDEEYED
jgi:hypothetical protein